MIAEEEEATFEEGMVIAVEVWVVGLERGLQSAHQYRPGGLWKRRSRCRDQKRLRPDSRLPQGYPSAPVRGQLARPCGSRSLAKRPRGRERKRRRRSWRESRNLGSPSKPRVPQK